MTWNTRTPRCAKKFAICGSIFDSSRLKRELAVIEQKTSDPAIWADPAKSQPLMRDRKRIENLLADDAELARLGGIPPAERVFMYLQVSTSPFLTVFKISVYIFHRLAM